MTHLVIPLSIGKVLAQKAIISSGWYLSHMVGHVDNLSFGIIHSMPLTVS